MQILQLKIQHTENELPKFDDIKCNKIIIKKKSYIQLPPPQGRNRPSSRQCWHQGNRLQMLSTCSKRSAKTFGKGKSASARRDQHEGLHSERQNADLWSRQGFPICRESNTDNTMATILGLGASGETMFPYTSSQSSPWSRTESPPAWHLGALALVS